MPASGKWTIIGAVLFSLFFVILFSYIIGNIFPLKGVDCDAPENRIRAEGSLFSAFDKG